MEYFSLKDNVLTINYEPVNDICIFTKYCIDLLANKNDDLYIKIDKDVNSLSSTYIGCMISASVTAQSINKKLHIICNESVKRWITMICGSHLSILTKENDE